VCDGHEEIDMIRIVGRVILISVCLIALAGVAQPIGLAAAPTIDPQVCAPLPPPSGTIVNVSTVSQLENAVNSATSGTTIRIADGTYNLNGVYLRIDVPNVTLRSASGNREAVILDGNYQTTEIIQIAASNVTIADLTLREAYDHPIHVMSSDAAHTLNTLIYNVHIIDPGEQAIKINPATAGYYTDNGTIACSHIELTDAGRPSIRNNCYTGGIDAHQSRNWIIRDNLIEGFWCSNGLAEHGIHLWRGCRDTLVEHNILRNNARGIGFGLVTDGSGRTYPDNPCPAATGYVDDFGGVIRNNFVYANSASLFSSEYGFDCGICAWNSCNARILHNTVYSTDPAHTFSSIEWRFSNTTASLINNLVNGQMRERDGAHGTLSNNLTTAQASWFINASTGDLHLQSTATSAIDKVTAPAEVGDDVDGDLRPIGSASDVGADEYGIPVPLAVSDLRVTHAATASNVLTATLRWTTPANALTTTLRYSGTLITVANWNDASLLTGNLSGSTNIYTATVPYTDGMIYFAHKAQNGTGWSPLSNNAFWPQKNVYLPIIRK
jgi:hypothetical protein